VELDADGDARHLHYAPYLDYRPLAADEPGVEPLPSAPSAPGSVASWNIRPRANTPSLTSSGASRGSAFAQAGANRQDRGGGKDRLTKEPSYWEHRAEQLKLDPTLGSGEAR